MQQRNRVFILLLVFSATLLQAQTNPLDLYKSGQSFLQMGDYYSSLDNFKQALSINPSYVDARKGMAEAYFLLQEYGEALVNAQQALKGADKRVDILTLLGRIYLGLNKMDEAGKQFQAALAIEPNNADAAYGKAEIAVFQGNYSEGTDLFERSLTVNPDSRRALLSLSLLHEQGGDVQKSVHYLNRALEIFSQDGTVLDFAIHYYSRNEDWKKAESLALKWQALDPDNRSIPILLGTIYNRLDRNEDAVSYFKKAVSIQQEDPLVWYLLGRSYMGLGSFDEALLSFRTVNLISPGDELSRIAMEDLLLREYPIGHAERIKAGKYHFDLAEFFEKSYQYDRAYNEYRTGRILSPLDLDGWWRYAAIQKSLGYPNRYREEMLALKREGYSNVNYLRVLELLESSEDFSFRNNWDGPLTESFTPVSLSLYFNRRESTLIHTGMEDALLGAIKNKLVQNPRFDVGSMKSIRDLSEAYRMSHAGHSDFYIVISISETERTISARCSVHLTRTGAVMNEFYILRSGNRRVSDTLVKTTENIVGSLPVKGSLIGLNDNKVLLNLGNIDGIEKGGEFVLLRRGAVRWTEQSPFVEFSPSDLLGSITVDDVQENESMGTLKRNSPFDLVNPGDEIFVLTEDLNLPESAAPSVNEELKSQLLRLY